MPLPTLRPAFPRAEVKLLSDPHLQAAPSGGGFEGYASLFGVADLGGDVVVAGAFADSLRQRGPDGVRMLWQHDPAEPVGRWLRIAEDARGLKVAGRLNLAVARARELASLMRDGGIDGLSIGFRAVEAVRDRRAGTRRLLKIDLWEISLVTFPMLPGARVSAAVAAKATPPPLVRSIRAATARLSSPSEKEAR